MKAFHCEIKKAFSRKELYISLSILLVLVGIDFIDKCLGFYGKADVNVFDAWHLWIGFGSTNAGLIGGNPIGTALTFFLLPMFSTMIYADVYVEERRSGLVECHLIRESREQYYLSKIIVSFLVSLIVIIIPFVFNQIMCLIAFPTESVAHFSNWPTSSDVILYETNSMLIPAIDMNYPLQSNLLRLVFIGLWAGTCSMVGTALSFFLRKRLLVTGGTTLFFAFVMYIVTATGNENFAPQVYLSGNSPLSTMNVSYFFIAILSYIVFAIVLTINKIYIDKDEIN